MTLAKFAGLLCLTSAPIFAGTWSGALVDSKCYESRERNVGPNDTLTSVDRDTREEIRYCSATPKTKSFTLVPETGPTFKLDSAGNTKAAQFVQGIGKKTLLVVNVTGAMNKNTIQVDSISAAR